MPNNVSLNRKLREAKTNVLVEKHAQGDTAQSNSTDVYKQHVHVHVVYMHKLHVHVDVHVYKLHVHGLAQIEEGVPGARGGGWSESRGRGDQGNVHLSGMTAK